MTLYNFPGYDDEPRDADNALQEWIDTQELDLSDEDTELLYSFTDRTAGAETNIRAIQSAADYHGIDLSHSPLPTPIPDSPFPILQGLVTAGHITFLGEEYIGHASDGTAVLIGSVGREALAEAYLTDHSTPDTW